MQQSVGSLIETHRENKAFNTVSEIKSMYQPNIMKETPLAFRCLKIKLRTLESSSSKFADNFTVDSCAESEKAESII